MGRINIEDARIRVEFRKNETGEVIKSEWLTSLLDSDLYEKELMYDYFEIDGHIFKH